MGLIGEVRVKTSEWAAPALGFCLFLAIICLMTSPDGNSTVICCCAWADLLDLMRGGHEYLSGQER